MVGDLPDHGSLFRRMDDGRRLYVEPGQLDQGHCGRVSSRRCLRCLHDMVAGMVRQRRKRVAAIGNLPIADLRVANRAATRGPVPADPHIRQAAEWLATNQLNESSRHRWLSLIGIVFVIVGIVDAALTSSAWWWLGAAAMLSLCAWFLVWRIQLKRRIEMLKHDPSE